MGDLVLVQFGKTYDQPQHMRLVQILENTFSNISTVFAQVKKSAYQLDANLTPVTNHNAAITNLISYTMQPNVLGKVGYNVDIQAYGIFAANANNKEIILYFGSDVLFDSTALPINGGTWLLQATVTRTSPTTQQAIVKVTSSNSTLPNTVVYTTPIQDLTTAIVIKCTGQGVATADITEIGQLVKVFPKE